MESGSLRQKDDGIPRQEKDALATPLTADFSDKGGRSESLAKIDTLDNGDAATSGHLNTPQDQGNNLQSTLRAGEELAMPATPLSKKGLPSLTGATHASGKPLGATSIHPGLLRPLTNVTPEGSLANGLELGLQTGKGKTGPAVGNKPDEQKGSGSVPTVSRNRADSWSATSTSALGWPFWRRQSSGGGAGPPIEGHAGKTNRFVQKAKIAITSASAIKEFRRNSATLHTDLLRTFVPDVLIKVSFNTKNKRMT